MTSAAPLLARESSLRRSTLRREFGVACLLGLLFAAAAIRNPAFLTARNLSDMLVQCVPALIVGCGLTFVIVAGEIDISVGSLFGLLAALMGVLASPQRLGLPIGVAVIATLAAGATIGLLNGLLVTIGRVPSIIVTLGMLSALRGATELVMGGEWITNLPPGLRALGTGASLNVPFSIWTAAICIALSLWLAHRTPLGRRLYAIGSNPDAARMAGLPITSAKLFAFTLTGTLTAVAALVSVPQLGVIESGLGVGFELLVVTAVVVGGASIRGGSGTIAGMLLAVLLLGTVRTVLLFLKLGDAAVYWERAIQGAFIIAAVLLDRMGRVQRAGGVDPSPKRSARVLVEMGVIRTNSRSRRAGIGARIRGAGALVSHQTILAALLVALLIAAGISRPAFVSPDTQISLAAQSIELAILAVPMTLLLITGGIDLSIGSIMALAAVVLGLAFEAGTPIWLAAALALLAGSLAGALNGIVIAFAGVHPLIVTLATLSLYRGVAEAVSSARPISGFPDSFIAISNTSVAGVPLPALIFLAILAVGWIMLRRAAAGRYLYAMGCNETACRFTGLPVDRIKLWLYTLSGAAAGLAAVLFVARRNTAKADIAAGMELDVITAVVLGGTSVFGGRGGLGGTLLGVLLLHEVRQFISWRWNNDELILVVVGGLLIGSVLLNQVLSRGRPDRALA